jgi:A/G-specific adenine glycosylase
MLSDARFKKIILTYYVEHGRSMPWRQTRSSYRILVSEIMLQQTQVARVREFYKNFTKRFPSMKALAGAKTPDVLRAWQGLGYNRRAIALQKLSREVMRQYAGRLPRDQKMLVALPGVGPYTASALRVFAFNQPASLIETNIRRVFIHFFFPMDGKSGKKNKKVTDAQLIRYIERTVDRKHPREWYYALMDYGAMLGREAQSGKRTTDPNRRSAGYVRQSKFSGSDREIRGKILREALKKGKVSKRRIQESFRESPQRIAKIIEGMEKDGLLMKKGIYLMIPA